MLTRLTRLPLPLHGVSVVLAFGVLRTIQKLLDASYAASLHPVDYATGQLAFDAAKIEGYYAVMIEAGTLEIYWRTQVIDFGFILSIMLFSVLLGTFLARLGGPGSWGWRAGMAAAVLGVTGASMDAIENLLSFVMLANPEEIPQGLAITYSGFAAMKFGLLTLAMMSALASLLIGATERAASALRPC